MSSEYGPGGSVTVGPPRPPMRRRHSTVLRTGEDLDAHLTGEVQAEQLEANTYPQTDLHHVGVEILARRREAATAAHRAGVVAVPLAASPVPVHPHPADDARPLSRDVPPFRPDRR